MFYEDRLVRCAPTSLLRRSRFCGGADTARGELLLGARAEGEKYQPSKWIKSMTVVHSVFVAEAQEPVRLDTHSTNLSLSLVARHLVRDQLHRLKTTKELQAATRMF